LINGLSTTDALIVAQYTTNGAQNIKSTWQMLLPA
jgi:hypothetical protein